MAEPLLLRDDADAVATLTLNDPARLNALSVAMLTALQDELDAAGRGPQRPGGDPARRRARRSAPATTCAR